MSTPESTPTHLPWVTLCQNRPYPYARVEFIPQSGSLDLASARLCEFAQRPKSIAEGTGQVGFEAG
jgi:hypothetical protein